MVTLVDSHRAHLRVRPRLVWYCLSTVLRLRATGAFYTPGSFDCVVNYQMVFKFEKPDCMNDNQPIILPAFDYVKLPSDVNNGCRNTAQYVCRLLPLIAEEEYLLFDMTSDF